NVREVADGPEVGEELKALAQFDVDAGEAAADGRGHGTLQSDAGALDGFAEFFGNVFVVLLKGFGAGGEAFPFEFDAGGFNHANGGLDDFGADTVAGDEGYFMCHKFMINVGAAALGCTVERSSAPTPIRSFLAQWAARVEKVARWLMRTVEIDRRTRSPSSPLLGIRGRA